MDSAMHGIDDDADEATSPWLGDDATAASVVAGSVNSVKGNVEIIARDEL
jgi:hypothetical protein